ncbi:MAG TPA: VWA domain-containing protein [Acidobacteriota bacterium]|nr:VWA domain-containing protein [Acidobacteriota bacterium]
MDVNAPGIPEGLRLATPEFLWLLALLAVLIGLYIFRQRRGGRGASIRFTTVNDARRVKPSPWVRIRHLPHLLGWLALAALIVALARPQTVRYEQLEEVLAYGADIMLVTDISGSMEALDFQPRNRLHVAKQVVSEFINSRSWDQIGLVAFAGLAATICPLTTNKDYLQKQVQALDFDLLEDGTAIGTALSTALNRLEGSKARSKVIILLTDGVNNRGEVLPLDAAAIAKDRNVRIYTVGIGSEGVVPFPNKPPYFGRSFEIGLDEELLRRIAADTGGAYRRATDPRALSRIYDEINKLEKTEVNVKIYRYPVEIEHFHWFLYGALIAMALAHLLRWTRLGVIP